MSGKILKLNEMGVIGVFAGVVIAVVVYKSYAAALAVIAEVYVCDNVIGLVGEKTAVNLKDKTGLKARVGFQPYVCGGFFFFCGGK